MPMTSTPGGSLYLDPDDPDDDVYTAERSKEHAQSEDAVHRELGHIAAQALSLARSLSQAAGLSAGTPTDGAVSALLSQEDTATYAAMLNVLTAVRLGVRADEHGVVGDGATDDTDALHAAAAQAATLGVPLVIPAGFVVGISAYKQLPPNLELHTNGATFRQIVAMGRAPVVGLGARSRVVGGLSVRTLGGDACQGVLISGAPDVVIDSVDVRASTPGAGKGNIRDNGLRVLNSDHLTIGRVFVENYDWGVWLEESRDVHLGHVEVRTYSLAVRSKGGCSGLRIGSGRTYGASPNSDYLPGYNGLLMENSTVSDDIRVDNFTVEDAGEHGVRVSGFVSQSNIIFTNCIARNSGGSGFKVLGGDAGEDTFRNVGIKFVNCTAIDSGSINQNCCGFLIQRARNVTLISPEVRKQSKPYSAVEGIRMSGVQYVTVSDARIMDTHKYAVHIDEACGSIQDVTFTNLHISSKTGHGIYLQNPGVEFRDMRFKGGLVEMWGTDAGAGFYAGRYTSEDTGTWRGMCELEMTFSDSTGATRQISSSCSPNALAAFIANITVWRAADAVSSWPEFAPGSMLLDRRIGARLVRSSSGVWNAA